MREIIRLKIVSWCDWKGLSGAHTEADDDGDYVTFEDHKEATVSLSSELERLREENDRLRAAIAEASKCLEGEPEYHYEGMGCGLEDRNITDRYDAMHHGWDCAMERVYGEHINGAREVLAALSPPTQGSVEP